MRKPRAKNVRLPKTRPRKGRGVVETEDIELFADEIESICVSTGFVSFYRSRDIVEEQDSEMDDPFDPPGSPSSSESDNEDKENNVPRDKPVQDKDSFQRKADELNAEFSDVDEFSLFIEDDNGVRLKQVGRNQLIVHPEQRKMREVTVTSPPPNPKPTSQQPVKERGGRKTIAQPRPRPTDHWILSPDVKTAGRPSAFQLPSPPPPPTHSTRPTRPPLPSTPAQSAHRAPRDFRTLLRESIAAPIDRNAVMRRQIIDSMTAATLNCPIEDLVREKTKQLAAARKTFAPHPIGVPDTVVERSFDDEVFPNSPSFHPHQQQNSMHDLENKSSENRQSIMDHQNTVHHHTVENQSDVHSQSKTVPSDSIQRESVGKEETNEKEKTTVDNTFVIPVTSFNRTPARKSGTQILSSTPLPNHGSKNSRLSTLLGAITPIGRASFGPPQFCSTPNSGEGAVSGVGGGVAHFDFEQTVNTTSDPSSPVVKTKKRRTGESVENGEGAEKESTVERMDTLEREESVAENTEDGESVDREEGAEKQTTAMVQEDMEEEEEEKKTAELSEVSLDGLFSPSPTCDALAEELERSIDLRSEEVMDRGTEPIQTKISSGERTIDRDEEKERDSGKKRGAENKIKDRDSGKRRESEEQTKERGSGKRRDSEKKTTARDSVKKAESEQQTEERDSGKRRETENQTTVRDISNMEESEIQKNQTSSRDTVMDTVEMENREESTHNSLLVQSAIDETVGVPVHTTQIENTVCMGDVPSRLQSTFGMGGREEDTFANGTNVNNTCGVADASGLSYLGQQNNQSVLGRSQSICQQSQLTRRNVSVSQIINESIMGYKGTPFFLYHYQGPMDDEFEKLKFVIGQDKVGEWRETLPDDIFDSVKKLGEGAYGEVYSTMWNKKPVALKVIPFTNLDGGFEGLVNGEVLKSPGEILPEMLITRELSNLCGGAERGLLYTAPNFIELKGARIVRGTYPPELMDAWDEFDAKKGSENDRPDTYAVENQPFLCIALAMGGVDIESATIASEEEALSILFQLIFAFIAAEKELEFEHRDLHNGNALIMPTEEEFIQYTFNGGSVSVRSFGTRVNVIDFTNSRMAKAGTKIYLDLEQDEELFNGQGNYQFDIYRMMRENNGGDWKPFNPKSNVFWLHYMSLELLMNKKHKKRVLAKRKKELKAVFDKLLTVDSLSDFMVLLNDDHVDLFNKYVVQLEDEGDELEE